MTIKTPTAADNVGEMRRKKALPPKGIGEQQYLRWSHDHRNFGHESTQGSVDRRRSHIFTACGGIGRHRACHLAVLANTSKVVRCKSLPCC